MPKKKILCVEDHQDTCELVTFVLSDYKIISADCIADALLQADKGKFSLYLIDYHLPDGTAFELCPLIRNFDTETPILIYSGTKAIVKSQVLNIGAQGFVNKSSNCFIEELKSEISRLAH